MKIKEVLVKLSDIELIAISEEINNPMVSNKSIYEQIVDKSNMKFDLDKFSSESLIERTVSFDRIQSFVIHLSNMLALELSRRLLEKNKEITKK